MKKTFEELHATNLMVCSMVSYWAAKRSSAEAD